MKLRVLNNRHGKILDKYYHYILSKAFELTEDGLDGNKRFMEYHKICKGIITQHNSYTEVDGERERQLLHEWIFMTPNLLFHSFNGFVCGLGYDEEVCSDDLMEKTFTVLKSFSDIANERELLESKFINYVRD